MTHLKDVVIVMKNDDELLPVLVFSVGSAKDPEGKDGLAHLCEHLIFIELTKRGIRQRESAATSYLHTSFFMNFDKDTKVEDIVNIIHSMEITEEMLESEKSIILNESYMANVDIDKESLLLSFLYSQKPDSKLTTPSCINNITIEDVKTFLEQYNEYDSFVLFEKHEDEDFVYNNERHLEHLLMDFDKLDPQDIGENGLNIKVNEHCKNKLKYTFFNILHAGVILDDPTISEKIINNLFNNIPEIRNELCEDYYFDIDYIIYGKYFIYYIISSDDFIIDDLISLLNNKGIDDTADFINVKGQLVMGHDYNFPNDKEMHLFRMKKSLENYGRRLMNKYDGLIVTPRLHSFLNCYNLVFTGEKYEYDDEFWKEVDAYILKHFTENDKYISYYYSDIIGGTEC